MTREEAKQIVIDAEYKAPDLFNLVDAIYNDFESRTCENCKYYVSFDICNHIENEQTGEWVSRMQITKDFGCNKWEAKTVSTDTKSHSQVS